MDYGDIYLGSFTGYRGDITRYDTIGLDLEEKGE